jgi:hypothetical protein
MTPADDYLSPQAFWLILLAFAVGCVVLAIVHAEHRWEARVRARVDEALRKNRSGDRRVHPHCMVWGHKYRPHQTVWMCGVCGDRIPRDTIEETA